ncbi:hypothetical protein ACIOGZ_28810 [Kitasatospora sp. NPDC088160]|uniref:hypothetical protein n=1 Tax=Kitasatospora sp. NPDC088160 TaxID=3364072 RepID=UPI00380BC0D4
MFVLPGIVGGPGGPLRGEQQPVQRSASRWVRVSVPQGLDVVLAPVLLEWARIRHDGGRRRVRAAIGKQLRLLAGLVGVDRAAGVLAARLERRLAAQVGVPVFSPVGWFLRRGLPQRVECYAAVCDDRVRMDTGLVCPSCELLVADSRALRHRVAQAVAVELAGVAPERLRVEVELRLGREVARQAAVDAVRRERAVRERASRDEAWARRREELASVEAGLAALPCVDCGVAEAGGLCLVCSQVRQVRRILDEAAQLATAAGGELGDPGLVAGRVEACRARLVARLEGAVAGRLGADAFGAERAWVRREAAEELLAGERRQLFEGLLGSPAAVVEAGRVFAAQRARCGDSGRARVVAEQARERCARALADERLAQVRAALAAADPTKRSVGGWRDRLSQWAARPLSEEVLAA